MKIIHFWRSELKLQKAKPTCYRRGLNCVPLPPHLMAPHSSTLAWKIPWMEEPGRLQSMESLRVGHDWETSLSLFTFMHWRRKWQPTPVFLPGESQDGGAWWAAIYGVAQSRTQLKRLSSSSSSLMWSNHWGLYDGLHWVDVDAELWVSSFQKKIRSPVHWAKYLAWKKVITPWKRSVIF